MSYSHLPTLQSQLKTYIHTGGTASLVTLMGVSQYTVRSWLVRPPTPDSLDYWVAGWVINIDHCLSREIAERNHLHELLGVVAYHRGDMRDLLLCLDLSEEGLVKLIRKKHFLSERRARALKPFVDEMYAEQEASMHIVSLGPHLKEISRILVGLNGLAPLVISRIQREYSEEVAVLGALVRG